MNGEAIWILNFLKLFCYQKFLFVEIVNLSLDVTVNESQMEIPAERLCLACRAEQRNKKTYLKFDVGENQENEEC